MRVIGAVVVILLLVTATIARADAGPDARCTLRSGRAAVACVQRYTTAVGGCRNRADAACETALRSGDALTEMLAATEKPTRRNCTRESAGKLNFTFGLDDLVFRTAQACSKWAEDFLAVSYKVAADTLSPAARACQARVAEQLRGLLDRVVNAFGRQCFVPESAGTGCDRPRRDRRVASARARAVTSIVKRCGATFDQLGLATGATLEERVATLADVVVARAHRLALRVYPPLGLGPTELFGPAPVGVRTIDLVDPSRLNYTGTGPRPVRVEVYYPSTAAAVAGVERDVLHLFGIDVPTIAYRDVARASGALPVVLYSHGAGGLRVENVTLAGHLASHGYLVISPDHHADTGFDDPVFDFPGTLVNRPLDLSFLIDQLLVFNADPGNFFEGAVDGGRIGASGHSLGGYAAMALASGPFQGPFQPGTFTDPRVKAVLALDPAVQDFAPFPSVLSSITVPTLLLSGTQSFLAPLQALVFGALLPGPDVMAFGNLTDAGHLSFMDICESPETLTGFVAECEPDHIPWRAALHIVNYLALNFFDATLNGDAEALARLDPAVLSVVEELTYLSK